MSLRAFHIVFIAVSTLLAAGFSAWCFANASASASYRPMGAGSAAAAAALVVYLAWFLKKTGRSGGAS